MLKKTRKTKTISHYQPPEWLRTARTVCFDGYSPPIYPDIRNFSAERLVEITLELNANVLRFQPIGYRAAYPSKVYPQLPDLKGRDLIDEVSKQCRRKGVYLYCYTGYTHPFVEVNWAKKHSEHADWFRHGPEGEIIGWFSHYGSDKRQHLCMLGQAYRRLIQTVVKELCEHDIEGVYFDAPSGYNYSGVCFCDYCRREFKKFSGIEIEKLIPPDFPSLSDNWLLRPTDFGGRIDSQAMAAWYAWANKVQTEDLKELRRIIHNSGKFMLFHNGGGWLTHSIHKQYQIPDGFMVEYSNQIYERLMLGFMGAAMAGPGKKLSQVYFGSYNTSVTPAHVVNYVQKPNIYNYVVHNTNLEDADEVRMEGFANMASGNMPIYCMANRLFYDIGGGNTSPAKEVFNFAQKHESLLRDSTIVGGISIVPTWESQRMWHCKQQSWNMNMSKAMALAFMDECINFNVYPSTEVNANWLKKQKVIVLCGASGISNEFAKSLTDWVKHGGSLLATWDTGLYKDSGKIHNNGGALKKVLGVEFNGQPLTCVPDSYFRFNVSHPALGQFQKGNIIQGDNTILPITVLKGARVLADCLDLGRNKSRGPAIVANRFGKGKAIYIAGSLEAHYGASRIPSLRQLLSSMVNYLFDGTAAQFKLSAPTGVYGILRQSANGSQLLWILANVGFKDAAVGRMRQDFVPVSNIEVSILIPPRRKIKQVRLLRSDLAVPFKISDGHVVFKIPSVHIAEVVNLK